jgi:hypothetical protein
MDEGGSDGDGLMVLNYTTTTDRPDRDPHRSNTAQKRAAIHTIRNTTNTTNNM